MEELDHILSHGLAWRPSVNFKALITPLKIAPFQPGPLGVPAAPVNFASFQPTKPNFLLMLFLWVKTIYLEAVAAGECSYSEKLAARDSAETARSSAFARHRDAYDADVQAKRGAAKIELEAIKQYQSAFATGDPELLARYAADVLAQSPYPHGFPQEADAYYVEDSKQMVVEDLSPDGRFSLTLRSFR